MRVLHLSSSLARVGGGPVSALIGLALAQKRAGLDVGVMTTYCGNPELATEELTSAGIDVRNIPAKNPMSRNPRLPEFLDEQMRSVDVMHIHAMWEMIQHEGARAAQRHNVPYVMTPHGMLDAWNFTNGRLKKKLYLALRMRKNLNRASLIHFATDIERDWTARLGLKAPTLVEPLGIDLAEFDSLPPRGNFRAKFPQLQGQHAVIFLGRLNAGKGLEVLIPAIARLDKSVSLVLVGPDTGYGPQAREQITKLGLTERVVFTGMLHGRERIEALVDADVLALPSFHENFGIVIVESLASGTPVVVSDQVGLHKVISSQKLGGVAPLDVEQLAAQLNIWLADTDARRDAIARARPYVFENFEWTRIGQRWVEHYKRLVS